MQVSLSFPKRGRIVVRPTYSPVVSMMGVVREWRGFARRAGLHSAALAMRRQGYPLSHALVILLPEHEDTALRRYQAELTR